MATFKQSLATMGAALVVGTGSVSAIGQTQDPFVLQVPDHVLHESVMEKLPGGEVRLITEGESMILPAVQHGQVHEHVSMVEALFLGVSCEPVTEAMAAQLPLPKGVGLLVMHVAPDSPAQRAGIKVHDVLVQLDDQWLITSKQLAVLVRMQEDDQEVAITLRRGGEQHVVEPELEIREMPALRRSAAEAPWRFMYPKGWADEVESLEIHPQGHLEGLPGGDARWRSMVPMFESDGRRSFTLRFRDQDHGIRLQMPEEGDGRVSIYGPDGKKLYESDLSQLEGLDKELRDKLSVLKDNLHDLDAWDEEMEGRLEALEERLAEARRRYWDAEEHEHEEEYFEEEEGHEEDEDDPEEDEHEEDVD